MNLISSMYNKLNYLDPHEVEDKKDTKNALALPEKCNSERFRKMVNIAVKKGIITIKNNNTLSFDGTDALLSLFCGAGICGDYLKWDPMTKNEIVKRGNENVFPVQALNQLFNVKNLGNSRGQIIEKLPPGGFERIKDIIKEAAI